MFPHKYLVHTCTLCTFVGISSKDPQAILCAIIIVRCTVDGKCGGGGGEGEGEGGYITGVRSRH